MNIRIYQAKYENRKSEIIVAYSDNEAIADALRYEKIYGGIFLLYELDNNFDLLRIVADEYIN